MHRVRGESLWPEGLGEQPVQDREQERDTVPPLQADGKEAVVLSDAGNTSVSRATL